MFSGCPVIISNNTPWRNLEYKKIGWDVSLDDLEKLYLALNTALKMNQSQYDKWSENAFNYAKSFCENRELIEANEKLFK